MEQKDNQAFLALVRQNELAQAVADSLYQVLAKCEIVLLFDDSSTMNTKIIEGDPFAVNLNVQTRWQELKRLAKTVIDFTTSINPAGVSVYFLNRPGPKGKINNAQALQGYFANPPKGRTPLIGKINQIYKDQRKLPQDKSLLIVIVTDGSPTDGSNGKLKNTIMGKAPNTYISLCECTNDEEVMDYLSNWNKDIQGFDNSDDYRVELQRVKAKMGQQFKFDYTDYVIKILLAPFLQKYKSLDMIQQGLNVQYQYNQQYNGCGCTIL